MTATTTRAPTDVAVRYRASRDRGRAIGDLCRLHIARLPVIVLTITAIAAGAGVRATVAGIVLIVSTCAIAAALNDRDDVVSDRVNGRLDRPFVGGDVSDRDVGSVVVGGTLVALVALVLLPQPTGLAVGAAAAFIGWASACRPLRLQRRGELGLVALATAYLVLPIVVAAGIEHVLTVAPLALVGAGVLAHKDVRDEVGDRAAGKRTVLVRVGPRRMTRLAALSTSVGVGALVATLGPGWWLVPATSTVGLLALMAGRGHDRRTWLWARVSLVTTAAAVGWVVGSIGA